ncbi:putative secreted protein (Por secretion system target) [Christiangramia gaetbulicola]|uniref:Putative secreted protein (Por secretion system target) n=1 Tax=Christiangramia gaetbulicola TaxID=703340 RepID=A0A2T6AGA6_9FLAO|nr:T9SS type A sorting domain-containing protein [Christiangramia gaetbulicola]PTX42835.1 putative secreted protein (Por secretion system target) [Christiangramia gaetbulicola]
MKLPLLFLMIFTASGINAQLYVAPSEKSDSYIYAKDRLVFVQNEIDLSENKKPETSASIYLRKGSQLVQGEKSSNKNKGKGKISVFQEGTSNAYDYNYWSLPVLVDQNGSKLNDYLFEPISSTNSKNAKLISALDGQSNPLSISNRWIYTFSGINYSNWAFIGDHFDLLPGEGFTMKGVTGINLNEIEGEPINKGNAQTYDFRGTANDGLIELPVKKDQLLLIGNPYPSALDLNKFLIENTSTTGIAYFWDSKENGNSHILADYEGGYGTYSPGVGVYVPPMFKKYSNDTETGESGKYYERKISPIGQGFMIRGKMDGMLSFRNSYRIFQKEHPDYSVFKSPETENSSLKLEVEIDSTYIQDLVLVFKDESSTEENHALDARKMNEDPKDISWSISNMAFVINVRPRVDQELIPLKIVLDKDSTLKFSISELTNFNPDRVFLYDAKDDLFFSIKTGYLKIDLGQGEYNDRFFLSFIEKLPDDSNAEKETISPEKKPENILLNSIEIFQNNPQQQLEVKLLYDAGIKNLSLHDLNGKLYFFEDFKTKEKEFDFPTGNLSNAVYIVKVKTTDNRELTKKISIRN